MTHLFILVLWQWLAALLCLPSLVSCCVCVCVCVCVSACSVQFGVRPCSRAPWLAYYVRSVSELNKLCSGVLLRWHDISEAPLWNSRVFLSGKQKVTCRHLILRGVLQIKDLIDTSSWTVSLPER